MNLSKTKAFWIGCKTKSLETLLAGEQLTWILQGQKFSDLGQSFSTSQDKILKSNHGPVISVIDELRACWENNKILTIRGKIKVMKSLPITKLVHYVMILLSLTLDLLKCLNKVFFTFI